MDQIPTRIFNCITKPSTTSLPECLIISPNHLPDPYQNVYMYHQFSTRSLPGCLHIPAHLDQTPTRMCKSITKSSTRSIHQILHQSTTRMSTDIINSLPDLYQDVCIYHQFSTRPLPEYQHISSSIFHQIPSICPQ